MSTWGDIFRQAAFDAGVWGTGQTLTSAAIEGARRRMNFQLSLWNRRRWLIYHLVDSAHTCDGSISYTVGAGGAFNIARPDQLEAAYIRQIVPSNPTPVDWSLTQIMSREEYSQLQLKKLAAAPSQYFFYDSDYPLGAVFPWPLPNSQYELHILTKAVLAQIVAVTDSIILPPEYEGLIHAVSVNSFRGAFRLPQDKYWTGQERAAFSTLRKSNFQVGRLSLPMGLTQGPAYSVFSDQGG